MTRSEAREIAMRLCFGISATGRDADEVLAEMLDKEYYESLREEDELYEKYPGLTTLIIDTLLDFLWMRKVIFSLSKNRHFVSFRRKR